VATTSAENARQRRDSEFQDFELINYLQQPRLAPSACGMGLDAARRSSFEIRYRDRTDGKSPHGIRSRDQAHAAANLVLPPPQIGAQPGGAGRHQLRRGRRSARRRGKNVLLYPWQQLSTPGGKHAPVIRPQSFTYVGIGCAARHCVPTATDNCPGLDPRWFARTDTECRRSKNPHLRRRAPLHCRPFRRWVISR
jgi:hypothetical protein